MSNKYDPAFTLLEDESLLTANVTIINNTNSIQELYPSTQFFIRTKDGLYYQMHPSMHIKDPLQSGNINPGQSISGKISFVVPKSLSRPLLYIDLGWENHTPIVYDILR
jgi:hypothetical protein